MADELRKYLGRNGGPGADADESDVESDDFGSFCALRGIKERAVCVELRKKNGDILAVNLGWIEKFQFEPSEGITLHAAGGQKIRIKGRNLNAGGRPLFQNLCRHRVLWVMETDRPANLKAAVDETVIEQIDW